MMLTDNKHDNDDIKVVDLIGPLGDGQEWTHTPINVKLSSAELISSLRQQLLEQG